MPVLPFLLKIPLKTKLSYKIIEYLKSAKKCTLKPKIASFQLLSQNSPRYACPQTWDAKLRTNPELPNESSVGKRGMLNTLRPSYVHIHYVRALGERHKYDSMYIVRF